MYLVSLEMLNNSLLHGHYKCAFFAQKTSQEHRCMNELSIFNGINENFLFVSFG